MYSLDNDSAKVRKLGESARGELVRAPALTSESGQHSRTLNIHNIQINTRNAEYMNNLAKLTGVHTNW